MFFLFAFVLEISIRRDANDLFDDEVILYAGDMTCGQYPYIFVGVIQESKENLVRCYILECPEFFYRIRFNRFVFRLDKDGKSLDGSFFRDRTKDCDHFSGQYCSVIIDDLCQYLRIFRGFFLEKIQTAFPELLVIYIFIQFSE